MMGGGERLGVSVEDRDWKRVSAGSSDLTMRGE